MYFSENSHITSHYKSTCIVFFCFKIVGPLPDTGYQYTNIPIHNAQPIFYKYYIFFCKKINN